MSDVIIEVQGLNFSYLDNSDDGSFKSVPAITDANLKIRRGEYLAVLGHNGSGKSTLAKLMNLILTPTSGKIFIDGEEICFSELTEDKLFEMRKKIGMVFQNPDNQMVATVVEEDVAFGPENLGLSREEIRKRVDDALALVGMSEYARHAPHKLSGGQKQRVAIAGIIAMRPDVIIFDESTSMLDPTGRASVLEIMERLNREENVTIINITHYMEEAARADRVVVVNDGRVELDSTPKEVFSRVDKLHSMGLEAPQSIELLHLLSERGISLDCTMISEDECVAEIYNLLKTEDNNG